MTDEQINAAIAEACGWTECRLVTKVVLSTVREPVAYGIPPNGTYEIACLNYCTNLNAMHEAEKVLDYERAESFADIMYNLCADQNSQLENPMPWRFAVCHATARQRAEALLRALSKWEEVQG